MSGRPLPPCQVCLLLRIPCTEDCLVARFYGRQSTVVDIALLKSYYNWQNMRRVLQSLPFNIRRVALVSLHREAQARQTNITFGESLELFTLRTENRELRAQNVSLQQQLANITTIQQPTEQVIPQTVTKQAIPQTVTKQALDKDKQAIRGGSQFEIGSSSQDPNEGLGKNIIDLTGEDNDDQTFSFLTNLCDLPGTPIPFGTEGNNEETEEDDNEDLFSIVSSATKKSKTDT